jgi:L-aspartate oxidase
MIHNVDVIIVGTGAAGLYAALCLPKDLQIALISKDKLPMSASDWAQGGIAAAMSPTDSPTLHLEDTLKAGAGLCDRQAVEFLVNNAPRCIEALVDMGVAFDRQLEHLAFTLEAAHSRPRVLHAADTTGRAVITTLVEQVLQRENIQIITPAFALDLWMEDNQCVGISLIRENQLVFMGSSAVILATGGGGQVYAQTTNPTVSTGDGVAMAARKGGLLRDLEFIQFHPTALTKKGAPRFLISEAVRGEGAHLVDHQGERFAFRYHPDGELAPRDVVSRAIYHHLQETSPHPTQDHVWLDLRRISHDKIRHRFPNIIQVCAQWGIDLFNDMIPVAPAAHYWMGGVYCDLDNRTSIEGLYVVGETASTGVHGANRLASNSLLECIVFGDRFRYLHPKKQPVINYQIQVKELDIQHWSEQLMVIKNIRQEIPNIMWQRAGISREEEGLNLGLEAIDELTGKFNQLNISKILSSINPDINYTFNPQIMADLRLWGETNNLLEIAKLILQSARHRRESRGGHFRRDYPHPNIAWEKHTEYRR